MQVILMRAVMMAVVLTVVQSAAEGQPLAITNVRSPSIHCFYSTDCTVTVEDTVDDLITVNDVVVGSLQTRTFHGQPGAPLEALRGYQFRVVVPDAAGDGGARCLDAFAVDFNGTIDRIAYNGDGVGADIYVITRGGVGSVAPIAVELVDGQLRVQFGRPGLCPGQSTYFFGFTSSEPPK
jgi:hypothetical protein